MHKILNKILCIMLINKDIIISNNYLDGNFSINFGKKTIIDKDIDDNEYHKLIRYMTNKSVTDNSVVLIIRKEPMYVALVFDFIANNLIWGTNVIKLEPKEIMSSVNIDKSEVSRAIKRLIELKFIVSANTIDKYKELNKYLYIVNHNYLFKGNSKNLIKDINEQRGII